MPGAPKILPCHLPSAEQIGFISATFQKEVRELEAVLMSAMRTTAKLNRCKDPNKILKDIAKPAVSPVCMLDESKSATVLELDEDEHAVVLDNSPDFDLTDSITASDSLITPLVGCEDKLWFDNDHPLPAVGTCLHQTKIVGGIQELLQTFSTEWKQRWDRHAETPESHWTPIVDFFNLAFPEVPPLTLGKITLDDWRKCLKAKSKHAATGPDGWARADLLAMPDHLTQTMLDMIHRIEEGHHDWPTQLLCGLIYSLEKTPNAKLVGQYRPITIFSVIYRTWSSIRARKLLLHLLEWAPATCHGSLPKRSATQMWLGLQLEMEAASQENREVSGCVLDIVKCFNHLPRIPVFGILKKLGAPQNVMLPWARAVVKMQRRFSVRGAVGNGILSTTGFPEGCPLSVVSMLATNLLLDQWMKLRAPSVRLWSFVDNLELVTEDPQNTIRGLQAMTTILEVLDLPLDSSKTYLWANETQARKTFAAAGQSVKKSARDLGGHMQYTQQNTNHVITLRIKEFKSRWKDLAISPAPYHHKLRAIKAAAWPAALHGSTSVHLGNEWFDELRTGAVRALGEHKPGCSPIVHLSLVEHPTHDPGFHAIWMAIAHCRQYIPPEVCKAHLDTIVEPSHRVRPRVGPCSVVHDRLQQLGWFWDPDGYYRDHTGHPIDLWETCIQELSKRASESWQWAAPTKVAHRKTLGDLHLMHPKFTLEKWGEHTQNKAYLRCNLNGSFFTADHLKHRDPNNPDTCKLCGMKDSLYHRMWECEQLEQCRNSLSELDKQELLDMPQCSHLHGWFALPTATQKFHQALSIIPDTSHDCFTLPAGDQVAEMFTDGACVAPQDRQNRLCAWGVVACMPSDWWSFVPIAHGLVPGVIQTIIRAELVATIAALSAAIQNRHKCRLRVDNQFVYKVLKLMINGEYQVRPMRRNHDLLAVLLTRVEDEAKHLLQGVVKVVSHQQCSDITSPEERWAFAGNDAAGHVASRAFGSQPELLELWEESREALQRTRALRDNFHSVLIAIGQHCTMAKSTEQGQQPQETYFEPRVLTMVPWLLPDALEGEASYYHVPEYAAIATWVKSLHQADGVIQRWSWHQLSLDAARQIKHFGPWYKHTTKEWKSGSQKQRRTVQQVGRAFALWMIRPAQALHIELPLVYCRPTSPLLCYGCATLPVQVQVGRGEYLDRYLAEHIRVAKKPGDLKDVPMDIAP